MMYEVKKLQDKYAIVDRHSCRFIASCFNKDNADTIVNILCKDDEEFRQAEEEKIQRMKAFNL